MNSFYSFSDIDAADDLRKNGVYSITNIQTGDVYIGSATRKFITRWRKHINDLRKNKHHSKYLQNAYNKYGEESFQFKILEFTTVDKAIEREQFYFHLLKPTYNICQVAGNCRGVKHNQQTKQKMRDSKLGAGENYSFNKARNKYYIYFLINNGRYSFGSYSDEKECIKMRDFLLTLTDEEKLEYWNNHHNRKLNIKGYTFNKNNNKYQVQLTINGKLKSFGYFKTESEAINKVKEIRDANI